MPGLPTTVTAINGGGQYVGYYDDSSGIPHGFISVGGSLQTFDYPQPGGTLLNGINNNGDVVGVGPSGHFLYSERDLHARGRSSPPDNHSFPFSFTEPNGVNDADDVVGTILTTGFQGSQMDGFLLHNGQYSLLDVPGATETQVYGINDSGVVVGTYINPDVSIHGFIYQNGVFTTVDDPDGVEGFGLGSGLLGINDAGQLAGSYSDDTGNSFGFIATPVAAVAAPEPGSLALLSAAGLTLAARRLRKRA